MATRRQRRKACRQPAGIGAGFALAPLSLLAEDFSKLVRIRRTRARRRDPRVDLLH